MHLLVLSLHADAQCFHSPDLARSQHQIHSQNDHACSQHGEDDGQGDHKVLECVDIAEIVIHLFLGQRSFLLDKSKGDDEVLGQEVEQTIYSGISRINYL